MLESRITELSLTEPLESLLSVCFEMRIENNAPRGKRAKCPQFAENV